MSRKPKDRRFYTVRADVKLRGATLEVEAESEEDARRIAEAEPFFDFHTAEMTDWRITDVKES